MIIVSTDGTDKTDRPLQKGDWLCFLNEADNSGFYFSIIADSGRTLLISRKSGVFVGVGEYSNKIVFYSGDFSKCDFLTLAGLIASAAGFKLGQKHDLKTGIKIQLA